MAHGKAIFEHADDEGEQPLLAQFHEDNDHLFLTFFDIRKDELVTVATHRGAEPFLRKVANMIDPVTWESQEIERLQQLQFHQLLNSQFTDPLVPHLERLEAAGNAKRPHEALQIIVAEWETLKAAAQNRSTAEAALSHKLHSIADPMERWADNQQLSYGSWGDILNQLFDLAEAGKILPEENRVLREHVKQSQEDLERKSLELYKAQELIAELSFALKRDHHAALGLLVKQARDYCEERGILASGEIPF